MIAVTSKMFQAISSLFQLELSLSTAQVYDHKFISSFLFQGNNFDICGVAAIFIALIFTDSSFRACTMATRELPECVTWLSQFQDYTGYARAVLVIWFTRKCINVTDIGLPKVMWDGFLFSPVMKF